MKVRQAKKEDFDRILDITAYSYGFNAAAARERYQLRFELTQDEQFVVEENGIITANTRCIPFMQNIRGTMKSMEGIAMVASDAESRRKGHIRATMEYLLQKMYKEGVCLSTLYPFKDTFYASFGYVNANPFAQLEIKPQFLRKWKKLPEGYYVKRQPYEEGLEIYKKLHKKFVAKMHGAVERSEKRWKEYQGPSMKWSAIAYNPKGQPEGIMIYSSKGFSVGFSWAEEGTLNIEDFIAISPEAKKSLFNFIFLHSDQINKVYFPMYYYTSELYPWLDGFFMAQIKVNNIWMARVVNVLNALQDLPTNNEGTVKFKLIDEQIKENNSTFEITIKNNAIQIKDLGKEKVNCELTIQGLSAMVYGILTAKELTVFNWINNATSNEIEFLEKTFPLERPWLTEGF